MAMHGGNKCLDECEDLMKKEMSHVGDDEISLGYDVQKDGERAVEERVGSLITELNSGHIFLNFGEEDQMTIEGYKENRTYHILSCILSTITCGILQLLFFWKPSFKLKFIFNHSSLKNSDVVYLKDQYENTFVESIKQLPRPPRAVGELGGEQEGDTAEATVSALKPLFGELLEATRYFENKKLKYLWNNKTMRFDKLRGLEVGTKCSDLFEMGGLSSSDQSELRSFFGVNLIDVPLTPYWKLLLTEALDPLYIFQLFSVVLWFCDNYIYFASIILIISVIILSQSVYEIRSNQSLLKTKIHPSKDVLVFRRDENESVETSSEYLVPGDLLEIPKRGCVMQCDAVLIRGDCIVNESMLTGESVPVTKCPLPPLSIPFDLAQHSRHILFSGTEVIQTRYYEQYKVYAVVLRTGFSTTKGELVRSIMFPKPMDFRFSRDVTKFILFLFLIASVGMVYTFVIMIRRGDGVWHMIVRALDLVTIVIPPTLPAALTTCVRLAEGRLKKKKIYCLSLRSLNMCGVLNVFCFDKTGTLTEEGLDLKCALPCHDPRNPATGDHSPLQLTSLNHPDFDPTAAKNTANRNSIPHFPSKYTTKKHLIPNPTSDPAAAINSPTTPTANMHSADIKKSESHALYSFGSEVTEVAKVMGETDHVVVAMASCHSITIVDDCLMGDPLDLKMFEASSWQFEKETKYDDIVPTIIKPPSDFQGSIQVGVVRVFPFSSQLQRMSVVTKRLDVENRYDCYVKGSPEMIVSFCKSSTVPENFHKVLTSYAQLGYRVIALAYKPCKKSYLKIQQLRRDTVEKDLTLLGLLVFENRLKPQSTPVIQLLKEACIRTLMVTGDNIQTALSVARKCGMVDKNDHAILVSTKHLREPPPEKNSSSTNEIKEETRMHEGNCDVEYTLCEEATKDVRDVGRGDDAGSNHYIMEGKTWAVIRKQQPQLLKKLARGGTVFARFLPEQKQQLIEVLQEDGKYVGMCGDGANDCGALKTAHTGVSLSEAEASVASPFTSNDPNITCVIKIIREGRAALVSSSGNFRFLAGYSLTQFISICLLYWIGASFTDFIFLYIDLVLIFSLSYTFNRTGAYKHLSAKPPSISLLSVPSVLSILLQLLLNTSFQVTVWSLTTQQPWFVPFVDNPSDIYQCHEVTTVFLLSSFQYIILAVVFSKGPPYRKSIFTNGWFMASIVLGTLLCTYFTLYPSYWIISLMELSPSPSMEFRLFILVLAVFNLILNFFVECVLVERLMRLKYARMARMKRWLWKRWRGQFRSALVGEGGLESGLEGRFALPSLQPITYSNISQLSSTTTTTHTTKALDADNLPLIDDTMPSFLQNSYHHKEQCQVPLLKIITNSSGFFPSDKDLKVATTNHLSNVSDSSSMNLVSNCVKVEIGDYF